MNIPPKISEVSIYENYDIDHPYPPAGWLPFSEHELGNGDMFGLYWPLGKEDEEPLVIEMWHDSCEMSPQYSSLATFLASSDALDDDNNCPKPTNPLDEKSPVVLVNQAQNLISDGNVTGAIKKLEQALGILPEYTLAKGLLVTQYRRVRDMASAVQICLDALRSPLSFGRINEQLPIWFTHQKDAIEPVTSDPLWIRRTDISWKFGSTKQNNTYLVLKEIIDEYAVRQEWANWYNMSQVYGELMYRETSVFQRQYNFNPKEWQINLVEKYRQETGIDRNAARSYKVG